MGIKHLAPLLKKFAHDAIIETNLKNHKGKIYAIDISIYMYKFVYNNGNYIENFCKQIKRLKKYDITPIYIFDGKPPKEKDGTIKERIDKKRELTDKIEKLMLLKDPEYSDTDEDTDDKIKQLTKKVITITRKHNEDCITLFQLLGISYIIANGEAEWLCAKLNKIGLVDYCVSEDMDVLANGGQNFVRGLNINNNNIIEYNLTNVLDCLKLDYNSFVDMCILCGCDYTDKIFGIGYLTAYKLIKMHGNIEGVIENFCEGSEKYKVPNNFDYNGARRLFKNDIPHDDLIKYKEYITNVDEINIDKLKDFLNDKINNKMIDEIITLFQPTTKKLKTEKSTTLKGQIPITNFFTKKE